MRQVIFLEEAVTSRPPGRDGTSYDSTRKITRFDSTRRTQIESSQSILYDSKMNSTSYSTFCNWANPNLVRMLIYSAIITDKRKISLQSPFFALTRESRARTLTWLEWLESLKSWLVPPLPPGPGAAMRHGWLTFSVITQHTHTP